VSVLQYFHNTRHKTHENHPKTHWKLKKNTKNSQYTRVLRAIFQEPKIATVFFAKTPFTKQLQNTAKRRKTLAKQSQNAFCEITSQIAKHCCKTHSTQNALKNFSQNAPQYSRNT